MTQKDVSSSFQRAERIYDDIYAERERQHSRWGVQRHAWPEWMCILTEEVGEAAQRANQSHWARSEEVRREQNRLLREELVQVAAVAVAMIEHLDEIAATGEPRADRGSAS